MSIKRQFAFLHLFAQDLQQTVFCRNRGCLKSIFAPFFLLIKIYIYIFFFLTTFPNRVLSCRASTVNKGDRPVDLGTTCVL